MKILLVHPEDDPENGLWADRQWDRIVDLGLGGVKTYERWSQRFDCPVSTLNSINPGFDDFRVVRNLLALGCGRLVDEHGLDWWEIMSILLHGELEMLVLLRAFAQTAANDEIWISRPGLHADLLQSLLSSSVQVFPQKQKASRARHYLGVSRRLSVPQIIDVLFDKYDSGYQVRGRIVGKRVPSSTPVVLLPTAYVNVSRTGLAYANTFPEENFLLVATRRSGWVRDLPKNVTAKWLSSYASIRNRRSENRQLETGWRSLRNELQATKEFRILDCLGYLNNFSRWFRHGLEVRDAWRTVLDTEPVQAVLCADDSNPYTRIPLLLAKGKGLPNIACHHGALDGRYFFKRTYGDVIWAKGRMEKDYLVRRCAVPAEIVEIAAPLLPANWSAPVPPSRPDFQSYILFFSEACDGAGGRQEEFYRDVLPPLADLARTTKRKLVVKLHPAEGESERSAMLARILDPDQKAATFLVSGPLTEELLSNAWFGITILSTVAMECAVRGIPCFLCKWLEFSRYGYVEQFIQFGVGIGLDAPSEIARIPQYMGSRAEAANVRENCCQAAAPGRLREFLKAPNRACATAAD